MSVAELQAIVDDLAALVDAPLLLEDAEQRVVVYSSHSSPIDEVRRDSIMSRNTTPEVMEYFREYGILDVAGPVRIPSLPARNIMGRLCLPARYRGQLMGFLWMIDDLDSICSDAVRLASEAVERIAHLMYDEGLGQRLTDRILSDLFSSSGELRESAARRLFDQGSFSRDIPCLVVALKPITLSRVDLRTIISLPLRTVRQESSFDKAFGLIYEDHVALLTVANSVPEDFIEAVASRAKDQLARALASSCSIRMIAAFGDPQPDLASAFISHRQARLAAKVATTMPAVGDRPRWQDLGIYRCLVQFPIDEVGRSALDRRLEPLLDDGALDLLETLETYLDLGCDAQATIRTLGLPRTSLYYRLNKIQRMCELDLKDGNERLAIHLSIKAMRFAGRHPVPHTA